MKKDNRFYIYEWFNTETDEVFYVGKGSGSRYKIKTGRNNYFTNYINKYKCSVRKIVENLIEDEAFKLEIEHIKKYRDSGQCKCNLTNGGEGATYEEGSWNQLFTSLQFSHDIRNTTNGMHNEEDYDSTNLKTKTTSELKIMYDEFQDYKYNNKMCRDSEIETEEKLSSFELNTKNIEIYELTKLICVNIANSNSKYLSYLNMQHEVDFLCSNFEWDDFLEELLNIGGLDYSRELILTTRYNMRYIKYLGEYNSITNSDKINIKFNLKSFNIREDNMWHIKFNTNEDKKMSRVRLDIRDLIMGIIISKNNNFYDLIYKEILSAQIYK